MIIIGICIAIILIGAASIHNRLKRYDVQEKLKVAREANKNAIIEARKISNI